jgi:hypothetical protein
MPKARTRSTFPSRRHQAARRPALWPTRGAPRRSNARSAPSRCLAAGPRSRTHRALAVLQPSRRRTQKKEADARGGTGDAVVRAKDMARRGRPHRWEEPGTSSSCHRTQRLLHLTTRHEALREHTTRRAGDRAVADPERRDVVLELGAALGFGNAPTRRLPAGPVAALGARVPMEVAVWRSRAREASCKLSMRTQNTLPDPWRPPRPQRARCFA